MNKKNKAGFTIFELIVVIAIIMLIGAIAVPNFVSFKKSSDLNNNVQEFENVLETAQNKAISSDSGSQYGVYINTTSSPNQYTLFKGESFDLRDPSADQNYFLQDSMEFYGINLGGGSEIIFERFRQGSELLTRNYEGAGLGLSISKAYVEMLGGKIWVKSEIHQGTTFFFTIPRNSKFID